MLNNLTGWHVMIILAVVLTLAVIVVLIVVVAKRLSRGSSRGIAASAPDPVGSLKALAGLRDQGLISEAEYEAKRQELLGRI